MEQDHLCRPFAKDLPFLEAFQAAARLRNCEVMAHWNGWSRGYPEDERLALEQGGAEAGRREGEEFLRRNPWENRRIDAFRVDTWDAKHSRPMLFRGYHDTLEEALAFLKIPLGKCDPSKATIRIVYFDAESSEEGWKDAFHPDDIHTYFHPVDGIAVRVTW